MNSTQESSQKKPAFDMMRTDLNLSVAEISGIFGVSHVSAWRWCQGHRTNKAAQLALRILWHLAVLNPEAYQQVLQHLEAFDIDRS